MSFSFTIDAQVTGSVVSGPTAATISEPPKFGTDYRHMLLNQRPLIASKTVWIKSMDGSSDEVSTAEQFIEVLKVCKFVFLNDNDNDNDNELTSRETSSNHLDFQFTSSLR